LLKFMVLAAADQVAVAAPVDQALVVAVAVGQAMMAAAVVALGRTVTMMLVVVVAVALCQTAVTQVAVLVQVEAGPPTGQLLEQLAQMQSLLVVLMASSLWMSMARAPVPTECRSGGSLCGLCLLQIGARME
jgi:hypothetical protein